MNQKPSLAFLPLQRADIVPASAIMKRAFDEDTRLHLGEDEGGPPGYDNGEFLSRWCFLDNSRACTILLDTRMIGVFNVFTQPNGHNFLGTMFLEPTMQNRGIGQRVWEHIEKSFPETRVWETETPGFSRRNHAFYVNKCGFQIFRIDNPADRYEAVYRLRKEMSIP